MNKFPTALSLPVFSGAVKRAIAYSKHFKHSKQRQNFIYLIGSILFTNSCLLQSVQSITLIVKSWQACLSKFLTSSAWNTNILNDILLSLFRKHASEFKYLALDWTSLVKTGKHFEWLCKVHDSRDDKIKDGFPLLLALGVSEGKNLKLPLHDTLASWNEPGFKSENTIIQTFLGRLKQRLEHANPALPANIVLLLDRGFYRATIIKELLKQRLLFVIHAKSNINIVLTDKDTGRKLETKLGKLAVGYYEKVFLNHLGKRLTVAVYFEKDKDKNEWKKMIIVTNLKQETQESLQVAYSHRWAIEEYFKELKQRYDLENFRVRSFVAIQRMIKLIMIAQALFTDSLIHNTYWQELLQRILMDFLDCKAEIQKTGIGLFREIAYRLANFGLVADFCLVLKEKQRFRNYVF